MIQDSSRHLLKTGAESWWDKIKFNQVRYIRTYMLGPKKPTVQAQYGVRHALISSTRKRHLEMELGCEFEMSVVWCSYKIKIMESEVPLLEAEFTEKKVNLLVNFSPYTWKSSLGPRCQVLEVIQMLAYTWESSLGWNAIRNDQRKRGNCKALSFKSLNPGVRLTLVLLTTDYVFIKPLSHCL